MAKYANNKRLNVLFLPIKMYFRSRKTYNTRNKLMELVIDPLVVVSGMMADFGANINQNIRIEIKTTETSFFMAICKILFKER